MREILNLWEIKTVFINIKITSPGPSLKQGGEIPLLQVDIMRCSKMTVAGENHQLFLLCYVVRNLVL